MTTHGTEQQPTITHVVLCPPHKHRTVEWALLLHGYTTVRAIPEPWLLDQWLLINLEHLTALEDRPVQWHAHPLPSTGPTWRTRLAAQLMSHLPPEDPPRFTGSLA